jgi:cytochrome c peroxidase
VAVGPTLGFAQTPPACNNQGLPIGCFFTPPLDTGNPLAPLRTVEPKPQDPQLAQGGPFIADQQRVLELGKAFFWDTQVGSDGQSCASCHFVAGADNRVRNAISPGLNAKPIDHTFDFGGFTSPNATISAANFPAHLLSDPNNRTSPVLRDSNDTVGSQGVFFRNFSEVQTFIPPFQRGIATPDICSSVPDPDNFQVHGVNVRRVEPRNTPTVVNIGFQNRQFWDSRAAEVFNGVDPFGGGNANARVYKADLLGLIISPVTVRIGLASGASQAVGPPLNSNEMSCAGRTFPDLGHKLLQLDPLGQQVVDPNDSVLGKLSSNQLRNGRTGLDTTYGAMIERGFNPHWWNSVLPVIVDGNVHTLREANFSLFWGLAVKAYMESLVADQTPVDQFLADSRVVLNPSAARGLNIFQSFKGVAPDPTDPSRMRTINVALSTGAPADARCITCHGGAETTIASISNAHDQRLERMRIRTGSCVIYDQGSINTGLRPPTDDPGLNSSDPFGNSFAQVVNAKLGILGRIIPNTPQSTAPYGLNLTADPAVTGPGLGGTSNCEGNNIDGTFKVPQVRNAELTGPYFHNGGLLTLMQVVDFYNRGGDFDNRDIDDNMHSLGLAEQDKRDLVSVLLAFTDERVAFDRAPFDHPSICVPNGQLGDQNGVTVAPPLPGGGPAPIAVDRKLCIDAVGAGGRATRLGTFLTADQFAH